MNTEFARFPNSQGKALGEDEVKAEERTVCKHVLPAQSGRMPSFRAAE
jgi:hypothetical protein